MNISEEGNSEMTIESKYPCCDTSYKQRKKCPIHEGEKTINSDKIILDLCGGTGAWSKPYKDAGYDVRIITLPGQNIVTYIPPPKVYGILFATPCTLWANSANRHWANRTPNTIIEHFEIFMTGMRIIMETEPIFWCIENPVGKMRRFLGKPKLIFNPSDYGDPYTKRTCLWGRFNIPKKNYVEPVEGSKMWWKYGGKSEKTKMLRSITPQGFAKAFFEANN